MPAQAPTTKRDWEHSIEGFGKQVPFEGINEPGCYVSNWGGHLLRIPVDAIKPGNAPVLEIVGQETLFTTKICNDPFVPVSKARQLAADCDVPVNF